MHELLRSFAATRGDEGVFVRRVRVLRTERQKVTTSYHAEMENGEKKQNNKKHTKVQLFEADTAGSSRCGSFRTRAQALVLHSSGNRFYYS